MKTIDHKEYTRLFNDYQKATYEYQHAKEAYWILPDLVTNYALQLKVATFLYQIFKIENNIKWGI